MQQILQRLLPALALLLIFLLPPRAYADVVTLRNGDTVEGQVLDVTRTKLTIKTKVHNIATTVTYRRSEIKDIEYKPLAEDFWGPPKSPKQDEEPSVGGREVEAPEGEDADDKKAPTTRRTREKKKPEDQYVVVPIEGGIGSEVTSDGLRKALAQSKGRGVGNIVFVVDSPGGYVYEAVNILDLLKEFDEFFEYHCVIQEGAISAASVFAAGSDQIYVRPDARLGGAVAYSKENSSGAAEVDAKFNSIWSANIASRADSKGHAGDIFRAMVVLEAELWQGEDGSLSPNRSPGATQIDGPKTILTIRASQMVDAGMATAFEGELSELGEVLGRPEWSEVPGIGIRAMTFAGRTRLDMERRFEKSLTTLGNATDTFAAEDPRQFTYRVLRSTNGTYRLDATSMREWTTRTDRAISACKVMLKCLKELAEINSKAQRTKALHLVTPKDAGHDAYVTIDRTLKWLKDRRNNPPARDMANPNFGP